MMNFFFSIRCYCYYHDFILQTCTVHISAMKLWMCAINCLRLYTWKNNAHISHIFLYVKASMLKIFFIFIINGFCFISWFVFLYSTRKVSVTLKKGNAPSRTDRKETSQVWHCPGRGDMYFSLGYNARLFGRFKTLYFYAEVKNIYFIMHGWSFCIWYEKIRLWQWNAVYFTWGRGKI